MRERWRFSVLDKLVPDRQTDGQTDRQTDTRSSWRSQKKIDNCEKSGRERWKLILDKTTRALHWEGGCQAILTKSTKVYLFCVSIGKSINKKAFWCKILIGLGLCLLLFQILQCFMSDILYNQYSGVIWRPIIWPLFKSGWPRKNSMDYQNIYIRESIYQISAS